MAEAAIDGDAVVAVVNGESVSVGDLLALVKWRGETGLIDELIECKLLESAADEFGIQIAGHMLQAAADAFRDRLGLASARATHRWLKARRISEAEFSQIVRFDLLRRLVTDHVATERAVGRHFAEHMAEFDRVELSRITVDDRELAAMLHRRIEAGEISFADAARRHSVDTATARRGGRLGWIYREDLAPALAAAAFSADGLCGPVAADGSSHLLLVHARKQGIADSEVREAIRRTIYADFIARRRKAASVSVSPD